MPDSAPPKVVYRVNDPNALKVFFDAMPSGLPAPSFGEYVTEAELDDYLRGLESALRDTVVGAMDRYVLDGDEKGDKREASSTKLKKAPLQADASGSSPVLNSGGDNVLAARPVYEGSGPGDLQIPKQPPIKASAQREKGIEDGDGGKKKENPDSFILSRTPRDDGYDVVRTRFGEYVAPGSTNTLWTREMFIEGVKAMVDPNTGRISRADKSFWTVFGRLKKRFGLNNIRDLINAAGFDYTGTRDPSGAQPGAGSKERGWYTNDNNFWREMSRFVNPDGSLAPFSDIEQAVKDPSSNLKAGLLTTIKNRGGIKGIEQTAYEMVVSGQMESYGIQKPDEPLGFREVSLMRQKRIAGARFPSKADVFDFVVDYMSKNDGECPTTHWLLENENINPGTLIGKSHFWPTAGEFYKDMKNMYRERFGNEGPPARSENNEADKTGETDATRTVVERVGDIKEVRESIEVRDARGGKEVKEGKKRGKEKKKKERPPPSDGYLSTRRVANGMGALSDTGEEPDAESASDRRYLIKEKEIFYNVLEVTKGGKFSDIRFEDEFSLGEWEKKLSKLPDRENLLNYFIREGVLKEVDAEQK